ncbi:MAG TPA: PKD domain-containing protein [Bacteroidales bacterium]|nr:PKD domain-containing protein [Bacteroidales bacterium]
MMKSLYCILAFTVLLLQPVYMQSPALYEVSRMSFNENVFSDISPVIIKDGIVFCSDRRFSNIVDRTSFDGRRLYNFYITKQKDSTRWDSPVLLENELKMLFNNGPLSISSDGKTVYFTSEVERGKLARKRNFRNHNGIFIAELSGTQLTGLQQFRFNNPDFETAHPSIDADGKFLYFASDKPGGLGGSDIYYSENKNGEWSEPVNMGPVINSSSDDSFPYIHSTGKLYFASDRPGGQGKLDLYSTSVFDGKWEKPMLLPYPINSSSDDFSFVASENLQTGYFASNRTSTDDIFSFKSTIIRKIACDELVENSYCFRFTEENAVKFDTIPFKYRWNFGDGHIEEGAVVEHCYDRTGKYTVTLDVVNLVSGEIIYNEKTDTLLVEDAVQPYINSPDSTNQGVDIRFDASATNLPGWSISEYYWNFDDESVATGEKVNKSYLRPGTYNVQLIVKGQTAGQGRIMEACVSKNIIIKSEP